VNGFDELFGVYVRAPFFLIQQLVPVIDSGSSIVLVSSLASTCRLWRDRGLRSDEVRSTP
jgi:NAD(P)-dependent dehydrogenase (short-subunit alcohol dehydrogenase family)